MSIKFNNLNSRIARQFHEPFPNLPFICALSHTGQQNATYA